MKNYNGHKFFRTKDDGEIEIIRVLRKKNENTVFVITEGDKNSRREMTAEKLSEYTLLKPHGMFGLNVVNVMEDKNHKDYDVIAIISRLGDPGDFAMCRQLIVNPFTEGIIGRTYGLAMSRVTCPNNVEYDMVKGCNGIKHSTNVAIYMDDTKETIMDMLKNMIPRCDKVLKQLQQRFKDAVGFSGSLEKLLEDQRFWEEYDRMFGIKYIDSTIKDDFLTLEQQTYLQEKISYLMDDITVVPYGYDINMRAIKGEFMLVRDNTNKLYLISYLRGSFITQKHLSEEELMKFASVKI